MLIWTISARLLGAFWAKLSAMSTNTLSTSGFEDCCEVCPRAPKAHKQKTKISEMTLLYQFILYKCDIHWMQPRCFWIQLTFRLFWACRCHGRTFGWHGSAR